MATAGEYRLSKREFDVVWSDLDCGAPPFPLEASSHGATFTEWADIRAEVRDALRSRGVLDARPDRGVTGLLRPLAQPESVVDLIGYTDRPLRAVAARSGQTAVLAELGTDGVVLNTIRPTALADSVVGLLPTAEPGPGGSMRLRHSDLVRAAGQEEDEEDFLGLSSEEDVLVESGMSTEDAARLLRLADERVGGGQLGVSVVDRRRSTMRRAPAVVSWFDTEAGRYLTVLEGDWLTLFPVDHKKISHRVDEILAAESA